MGILLRDKFMANMGRRNVLHMMESFSMLQMTAELNKVFSST